MFFTSSAPSLCLLPGKYLLLLHVEQHTTTIRLCVCVCVRTLTNTHTQASFSLPGFMSVTSVVVPESSFFAASAIWAICRRHEKTRETSQFPVLSDDSDDDSDPSVFHV